MDDVVGEGRAEVRREEGSIEGVITGLLVSVTMSRLDGSGLLRGGGGSGIWIVILGGLVEDDSSSEMGGLMNACGTEERRALIFSPALSLEGSTLPFESRSAVTVPESGLLIPLSLLCLLCARFSSEGRLAGLTGLKLPLFAASCIIIAPPELLVVEVTGLTALSSLGSEVLLSPSKPLSKK